MSHHNVASARVVAVLLADGWHRIVRGSFHVGPLSFEAAAAGGPGKSSEAGSGTPGFRFEEADAGSPYQPTVLAGPLGSIIAVRQVTPALRGVVESDRASAAVGGRRADHEARLRAHPSRAAARG